MINEIQCSTCARFFNHVKTKEQCEKFDPIPWEIISGVKDCPYYRKKATKRDAAETFYGKPGHRA